MKRIGYIYLMTNKNNTVIYTGVTNDLKRRVYEHKIGEFNGYFTHKFNVSKLVYFKIFTFIEQAIEREKQIKGGSRQKKIDLINSFSPEWKDLFEAI
jgi:putative endonuclease